MPRCAGSALTETARRREVHRGRAGALEAVGADARSFESRAGVYGHIVRIQNARDHSHVRARRSGHVIQKSS